MRAFTLVFLALYVPSMAHAAQISFTSESHEAKHMVRMFLDTENTLINVIEGTIDAGVPVHSVETGDSIIGLWIDDPVIEGSRVTFAGMIPGGFHGTLAPGGLVGRGLVLTLIVEEIPSTISRVDARAYLHDGEGTQVPLEPLSSVATVEMKPGPDVSPPEAVKVEILQADGETPALLIALGTDTGSGIGRYDVSFDAGEWQTFRSPRELSETELSQSIVVRIFDKAGNFREVIVQDGEEGPFLSIVFAVAVLIALFATALAVLQIRTRRR